MTKDFSASFKTVLNYSKEEAIKLNSEIIEIEHIFLGLLRYGKGLAIEYLGTYEIQLEELRIDIEDAIRNLNPINIKEDQTKLSKSAERILKRMKKESVLLEQKINSIHLLLAVLKDSNNHITSILNEYDITYNTVFDFCKKGYMEVNFEAEQEEQFSEESQSRHQHKENKTVSGQSHTPVLDRYGIDLTKAAQENRLDPIVGREEEIERISQILSRRKKNNPILVGESGVGKSAIVEGLATRITKKQVSRLLLGKRIITLDMASVVAGTKYRGQFEERMKSILKELSHNKDVIVFIDEIHTIVGAGGAAGSVDAANMLKPALARGEIQCIGATTLDEYRQHIEKDAALERRFQKILVEPTDEEQSLEILYNIKERYEKHHNVTYTDSALKACVNLSVRYVSDRNLPDKAIDALDEAGARVHIKNVKVPERILALEKHISDTEKLKIDVVKKQDFERAAQFRDMERQLLRNLEEEKQLWQKELEQNPAVVDEEKIAEVIAMMTGVPVQRVAQEESSRLLKMYDEIEHLVIGQQEAIKTIVKSIQRNRAGLKDPNRPIGSFIFLGPTGVGKTQLAKVLTEYLFESHDNLIRIDMSEYMEKFSVSRLVGAPPGYVGYEEGGQLTEKVRHKPYSIVLLDEVEKAHPDVFHLLLQVLDEGQLTDSLGRKIDFRNTIVIMTSNIGSRQVMNYGQGVGFNTQAQKDSLDNRKDSIIKKALDKAFAPEFLNRIDEIVLFNQLKKDDIRKIIDIELVDLIQRVEKVGFSIDITSEAKDFLAEKGYEPKYGARPLKRAIQKYIENPLSESIIKYKTEEDNSKKNIIVGFSEEDNKIVININ